MPRVTQDKVKARKRTRKPKKSKKLRTARTRLIVAVGLVALVILLVVSVILIMKTQSESKGVVNLVDSQPATQQQQNVLLRSDNTVADITRSFVGSWKGLAVIAVLVILIASLYIFSATNMPSEEDELPVAETDITEDDPIDGDDDGSYFLLFGGVVFIVAVIGVVIYFKAEKKPQPPPPVPAPPKPAFSYSTCINKIAQETCQIIIANCDAEGVFRQTGAVTAAASIVNSYQQSTFSLPATTDVHLAAAVLKKALTELEQPFLSHQEVNRVATTLPIPLDDVVDLTTDPSHRPGWQHILAAICAVARSPHSKMTTTTIVVAFGFSLLESKGSTGLAFGAAGDLNVVLSAYVQNKC